MLCPKALIRTVVFSLSVIVSISGAVLFTPHARAESLPSSFLFSTDITQPSGVSLQAKAPQTGMTLYTKAPESSIWQTPYGTKVLSDGTVQIWYLQVDYDTSVGYQNQQVLAMGQIQNGQWSLPALKPGSPPWGGPNNVVMTRSPYASTWGGFAPFQIQQVPNGTSNQMQMLYWDQAAPQPAQAGAMIATSNDGGLNWTKQTHTVFTDYNDSFTMMQVGNQEYVYQAELQPWPNKPYPDNLYAYKRVIILRKSSDNMNTWTPQDINNPTLAPDASDPTGTEFYCFKTFKYGSGYGGLMWKYQADPNRPYEHSQIFHYEIMTSPDGINWQRPYRDTDVGFWSYADPFSMDGNMWFATQGAPGTPIEGSSLLKGWGQGRMIGTNGAGTFKTNAYLRPDLGKITLNADITSGFVQVTLCDSSGNPIAGVTPAFFSGVNSASIALPWQGNTVPTDFSLSVRVGGAATVYGFGSGFTLLLGDANFDGHVDAKDIAALTSALSNISGYELLKNVSDADMLKADDMNGDGKINGADLQGLLTYLKTGHGSESVPEPASCVLLGLASIGLMVCRRQSRRNRYAATVRPK